MFGLDKTARVFSMQLPDARHTQEALEAESSRLEEILPELEEKAQDVPQVLIQPMNIHANYSQIHPAWKRLYRAEREIDAAEFLILRLSYYSYQDREQLYLPAYRSTVPKVVAGNSLVKRYNSTNDIEHKNTGRIPLHPVVQAVGLATVIRTFKSRAGS